VKHWHIERAAHDFLITLVFDSCSSVPECAFASVENGADFLRDLFKKLTSTAHKMPGISPRTRRVLPAQHLDQPVLEDDVHEVVELMGADRVIFAPTGRTSRACRAARLRGRELKAFDDETRRKILRDNAAS